MFFRHMTVNAYIIIYGNNARKTVHTLVHAHLKDILGCLQTEEHVQEPLPAIVGVKGGQVGGFLIMVYGPENIPSIHFTEASSTT